MTENLAARVLHTAELVGYQEGAVVSRTLINQKTGTVTLFAFDAGQELSEHTAPYDALVQVLDGETEITIAGQPYHLQGGRCHHHAGERSACGESADQVQDDVDDDQIVMRDAKERRDDGTGRAGRTNQSAPDWCARPPVMMCGAAGAARTACTSSRLKMI